MEYENMSAEALPPLDYEKLQKAFNELTLQSTYLSNVGQLAAGIAHEIRNPLTTIKGFIQLIKPYLVEIEKEEYANIALDEIERANKILFQFLNAAKPQVNETKLVNVNQLLQEISILFEGEASLRNIMIKTKLAAESPYLLVDEQQLKQVLVNLVKNAMEAISSTDGIISLVTEVINEQVRISIKDNGCGMNEETMSKIYTPFYSTKTTGTGLGLSICNQIIHQFGGRMDINSQLNEGTTFLVCLPLQPLF
jgi:signal transduction histidine kinase